MYVARIGVLLAGLLCSSIGQAQVGNNTALLNPNLATEAELKAIPGLNAALADAIVAARPIVSAEALAGILDPVEAEQLNAVFGQLFLPINLNTASREELMLIPGMSSRTAYEFEAHRPYTSLEQFRREIGQYLDENEVARLEQYVFVPMSLNTATRDAFMTIPGMTVRMALEFEAYRPYTSLEQFRREIGKYVDGDELARLERYVTVSE